MVQLKEKLVFGDTISTASGIKGIVIKNKIALETGEILSLKGFNSNLIAMHNCEWTIITLNNKNLRTELPDLCLYEIKSRLPNSEFKLYLKIGNYYVNQERETLEFHQVNYDSGEYIIYSIFECNKAFLKGKLIYNRLQK